MTIIPGNIGLTIYEVFRCEHPYYICGKIADILDKDKIIKIISIN